MTNYTPDTDELLVRAFQEYCKLNDYFERNPCNYSARRLKSAMYDIRVLIKARSKELTVTGNAATAKKQTYSDEELKGMQEQMQLARSVNPRVKD